MSLLVAIGRARTTTLGRLKHTILSTPQRYLSTVELDDRKAGRQRVVILGAGWAATSCLRGLSEKDYQSLVISPRPYFVFTPLLASTAVGTLEPRTALESVRAMGEYWEASVQSIDFAKKEVICTSALQQWDPSKSFSIKYDKLVMAVGAHTQTFNIPGVREHAFFLKETRDAIKIRKRILGCFEEASLPSTTDDRKRQLLHFCIVGGGPTGVEFSAELHDLIHDDLARYYPSLMPLVSISMYDVAPRILSTFDSVLADYAANTFARQGIHVHTRSTVTKVEDGILYLKNSEPVKYGMLVWSTGLEMTPLIKSLEGVKKDEKAGRVMTDGYLRLLQPSQGEEQQAKVVPDVYAIGDCAVIDGEELPSTAQVASQKGAWLRRHLNRLAKKGVKPTPVTIESTTQTTSPETQLSESSEPKDLETGVGRGFRYHNIMTLAYIGSWKAIAQGNHGHGLRGRLAWFLWRGAYMTRTISLRNKIRVPILWAINFIFGRDITHL
ncbi:hypothetical protein FRC15_000605 [Serendipita sp. 397]|nr:hypothetical protein FRC15_000605 [Serendipita sp. 397]